MPIRDTCIPPVAAVEGPLCPHLLVHLCKRDLPTTRHSMPSLPYVLLFLHRQERMDVGSIATFLPAISASGLLISAHQAFSSYLGHWILVDPSPLLTWPVRWRRESLCAVSSNHLSVPFVPCSNMLHPLLCTQPARTSPASLTPHQNALWEHWIQRPAECHPNRRRSCGPHLGPLSASPSYHTSLCHCLVFYDLSEKWGELYTDCRCGEIIYAVMCSMFLTKTIIGLDLYVKFGVFIVGLLRCAFNGTADKLSRLPCIKCGRLPYTHRAAVFAYIEYHFTSCSSVSTN